MAEDRAIALCEGGPLDGCSVSVLLEDGAPQPLHSRAEVVGVLYVPAGEVEFLDEHQSESVTVVTNDGKEYEVVVPLFGTEHERTFKYVPEGA